MTSINQFTKTHINFDEFEPERLTSTPPERKQVPKVLPEQFYQQLTLMYNRGSPESKILDEFKIEGCIMESSFGIRSEPGQNGKIDNSVACRLKSTNPDHVKFVNTFDSIYHRCANVLGSVKAQVKMFKFNPEDPEAGGFNGPIYRQKDKATGEPIDGRDPSIYLKLFSRGSGQYAEQTLFTNLRGEPVPWSLLKNVEMKFIPLIHVKRIFIGAKISLQMEVISAIVLEARARNSASLQTDTLLRLQQQNPDLVDSVSAQLAKLATDRQDQLLGTPSTPCPPENGASQPTYLGIMPSGQESKPTMSSISDRSEKPEREPKVNIPNIGDFTAGAPLRFS